MSDHTPSVNPKYKSYGTVRVAMEVVAYVHLPLVDEYDEDGEIPLSRQDAERAFEAASNALNDCGILLGDDDQRDWARVEISADDGAIFFGSDDWDTNAVMLEDVRPIRKHDGSQPFGYVSPKAASTEGGAQ